MWCRSCIIFRYQTFWNYGILIFVDVSLMLLAEWMGFVSNSARAMCGGEISQVFLQISWGSCCPETPRERWKGTGPRGSGEPGRPEHCVVNKHQLQGLEATERSERSRQGIVNCLTAMGNASLYSLPFFSSPSLSPSLSFHCLCYSNFLSLTMLQVGVSCVMWESECI